MSGTSNESSKHGRPIKLGGKPMKVASAAKARTTTGKRKRRSIAVNSYVPIDIAT